MKTFFAWLLAVCILSIGAFDAIACEMGEHIYCDGGVKRCSCGCDCDAWPYPELGCVYTIGTCCCTRGVLA